MSLKKEESLAKISKDLMLKEPFYGFLLIMLNKVWNNRAVKTAAVAKHTINYQLVIDEKFWESLSNDHRMGVLKHELLHIGFFHLTNWHKYRDKKLANIAMDMEINQYISESWLPSAEMSKEEFDEAYNELANQIKSDYENEIITAEECVEKLRAEIPARPILIKDYSDLNLEERAGTRYYYNKLKEAKDRKDQTGSSGDSNYDKLCDQMDAEGDPCDHGLWEEFDNLSEAEEKLIEKQVNNILRAAAELTKKKRGTVPGELAGYILEMDNIPPPKFDWRGYIRRFTGTSTKVFTRKLRRKLNKRYDQNPGLKIKKKQHMLLGVDTSGSVSDDELREFMTEIHHIYNTGVNVTIVQCDSAIVSIDEYKGKWDQQKFGGRGGTSFDPVIEYFNANTKKYTSLVYFTDGEAWTTLKPKGRSLWVLSECSDMNNELPGHVIKLEL